MPSVYNLEKWDVKTDSGSVEKALEVFKRKGQPRYSQKLWLVDKSDATKTIYVQYATGSAQGKVLFSPNEDFVFYSGLSPAGTSVVYGMNLITSDEFIVDSGVDFNMFTCPNTNTSYVIVEQNGAAEVSYQVYNLNREKVVVLTEGVNLDNLGQYICN
ncbi:hypothetical protein ACFL1E_07550 [Candidatus Omnitrophota bacterium]